MRDLPSGTVTFLYTDVEGSTRRWEAHPAAMRAAMARHDALLRGAIDDYGGAVFRTMGDAFCAAFPLARDAVAAALAAQRALHEEAWPPEVGALRVRMALHAGPGEVRDGDYVGPHLNRIARLLATGHGGQTLLSQVVCQLARDALPPGVSLRDLGEHRLKDLERPEHIYQLVAPGLPTDFPPLKTADPTPAAAPVVSLPPPTALVGRERELALLRERLGAALAGQGGLVLVGGEAGIGKTTLAEALGREAADRGAQVAIGRCYDLAETPPYGPWREALAALPQGADLPTLPGALDPAGRGEAVASQEALFARAHAYLAAVAGRRPLLLLLDDLHWADRASLDLLRHLARHLAGLPLLLPATYRADEITRRHPLSQLLPLLVREGRADRLDLRALPAEAVRGLVRARYALPAPEEAQLAAYLQERAEGHPLFVGELLRTLEEEGALRPSDGGWALGDLGAVRVPTLLRQVIEGRLDRLGAEEQRLLGIAAVVGQEVPLELWAAVAEVDEDALLGVAERAGEARLLGELPDGSGVRFAHALIREALYEGIAPLRRRRTHRAVGDELAGAPNPDPDAVAYHFQQAGDNRAAEWLIRAGERAQRAYALLTAGERFEAALTLLEGQGADPAARAGLLYRLARMRRYADPRQAIALLDDATELATQAGDPLLAAYITCARGFLRCGAWEIRRGLAELAQGMAAFDNFAPTELARLPALQEQLGDPPEEHHYRGALANWLALVGRYAEAQAQGERVVAGRAAPALRGAGTSFYANAWRGLASAHAALGRPAEARQAYTSAAEAYRAVEHHYQVGNTLALDLYEVVLPYRTDDLAERRRLAAEAEAAWTRASGALADLPTHLAHAPLLLLEGGWAEARELLLAVRAPGGWTQWREFATTLLARLAREQGEWDLAWALVRERLQDGPDCEPGDTIFPDAQRLQRLAAALSLDAGDLPAARAWLAAHDRWLAWSGAVGGRADGALGWAAYHRAAGDTALAHQHAERALAQATEPRQPLALLAAHRLLGELATGASDYAEAQAHLDAALALAEACAAPYERALTLLALADLRTAAGRGEEARVLLEEVRAICAPLEARPALARVAALAARLVAEQPPASSTSTI